MSEYISSGVYDHSSEGEGVAPAQEQSENERSFLPTETLFLNGALTEIGATRITAIDDNSVNANHCLVLYPPLLDSVLRMHHWGFAGAQAQLSQLAGKPTYGFNLWYALPVDHLKLRMFNGTPLAPDDPFWYNPTTRRYLVMGKRLQTNESPVYIDYTRRVTDPNMWDPLFYQVMQTWIMSKLANAIPKDSKKAIDFLTLVTTVLLPQAIEADSQENNYAPVTNDFLTRGR